MHVSATYAIINEYETGSTPDSAMSYFEYLFIFSKEKSRVTIIYN